ncbi:hypothetical protein KW846_03455 [Pseudomonas sp. PDM32]|uniref:hypothetical protein n=1 Tax=Pseudomonas sp. PDM32 TaxID=2854768 RepID=UPI001C44E6EE|nr:hypothetical protein [Pseudomonas sp. PDM32]MBV7571749.1 hypothetical protein [Pseudomonas sp. PDM32]
MTKIILIVYTLVTSLAYTALVAYFSTQTSGWSISYIGAILIAATALIAVGREKISDVDTNKKLKEKTDEIDALKKQLKQKQAMLHSVKSNVIHNVINVSSADELLSTMKGLATLLNESPAINNIDFDSDLDAGGYLDILKIKVKTQ